MAGGTTTPVSTRILVYPMLEIIFFEFKANRKVIHAMTKIIG